jgi:hypothetical protein
MTDTFDRYLASVTTAATAGKTSTATGTFLAEIKMIIGREEQIPALELHIRLGESIPFPWFHTQ